MCRARRCADARARGHPRPRGRRGSPSPTPAGPGPAQFNQVWVDKYGPKNGKHVLVLMPGTIAGSGNFTLTARYLVKHVPGLQVWAIDRRSQALEDTTMFAQTLRGEKSLQEMFDYYLGYLDGATPPDPPHLRQRRLASLRPRSGACRSRSRTPARSCCKARAKGKRKVILGGHSLGASLTTAYAAWDFNGRPGHKDIVGMVAIDGGLLGSFDSLDSLAETQAAIDDLSTGNPFADLLGFGIPEITGLFAEVGGIYARLAPNSSASTLQDFALLPPQFNPPDPRHQRGAVRLRVRPRHLAGGPGADPHERRHAGGLGRPAAVGRTVASRRSPGWPRPSARSPPTGSSGTSRGG